MHEAFKEEDIVKKVGGRFKLSSLIQKRLVALNRGAQPLVELGTKDKVAIVVEEIMQNKIFLDTSGDLRVAVDSADGIGAKDGGPSLADL